MGGRKQPTYADLMVATDGDGQSRSFLSTEESFGFLKDLESRNLLVPVVGNFAGPKAIRAVGKYPEEEWDNRVGVLSLECGAVSPSGRHLA